jgi:dipeptidyl aminopeptidase/acylaminoacyl peptidase
MIHGRDGHVTQFHDLQEYIAIPRVEGLAMSPDGQRLVAAVKTLAQDRKKYVTALWDIDTGGERPPRRLTRSAEGESGPVFLPDGTLLFISARPGPRADGDAKAEDKPSLWALPAGGEATRVATRPGGIQAPVVAREAGTVVFAADTLPGDAAGDQERRKMRTDAGISAILHEENPVRYWDHQLGPDHPRLFALASEALGLATDGLAGQPAPQDAARDLTPDPGQALVEQDADVTPDGSVVVTGWFVPDGRAGQYSELVTINVGTGQRSTLLTRDSIDFTEPKVSPDGRAVVCGAELTGSMTEQPDKTLWFVPLDGSPACDLLPGVELWPGGQTWSPDSGTVYYTADQRGRAPVFAVAVATGAVRQVTPDDGAYDTLSVSPDGRVLYALRAAVDAPPAPVRIDAATGEVTTLPAPGSPLTLPGRLTEITAAAPDGTEIRGWLVLPAVEEESTAAENPAPLVLWVHGGPFSSWNTWSWRWNPWIMAAHGYAVLLPDPCLSTGYGREHIRRGYGRWGDATFDDVMAITDAALARDDIDQSRTAMMGGSFGGYMANWIAGHTDRFGAIVAHASLWKLDVMLTSDESFQIIREFGDPTEHPSLWEANDPSRHATKIRTPMLVIHGDKDYRVPIGNALWQWWDLLRNQVEAKFLYFPDENHWILGPGNAVVWYETVLAFLAQHVLGQPWQRPRSL